MKKIMLFIFGILFCLSLSSCKSHEVSIKFYDYNNSATYDEFMKALSEALDNNYEFNSDENAFDFEYILESFTSYDRLTDYINEEKDDKSSYSTFYSCNTNKFDNDKSLFVTETIIDNFTNRTGHDVNTNLTSKKHFFELDGKLMMANPEELKYYQFNSSYKSTSEYAQSVFNSFILDLKYKMEHFYTNSKNVEHVYFVDNNLFTKVSKLEENDFNPTYETKREDECVYQLKVLDNQIIFQYEIKSKNIDIYADYESTTLKIEKSKVEIKKKNQILRRINLNHYDLLPYEYNQNITG